ncbi:hypothetical protein H7H51_11660, partial [Mycolicibacterium farcinogenes]|nr:hypothetical protein [Mycolicibacterium farcinogenes]
MEPTGGIGEVARSRRAIRLGSTFTNLNRLDELEWITHGEVVRYVPGEEIAFRIAEN